MKILVTNPEIWPMFTGIIETTGTITAITSKGANKSFRINSSLSASLKVDQSLSHDGVCLTVEEVSENSHQVTAIAETLEKTNLNSWTEGSEINLERCMIMNGRIDGHIVQGHVDTTALCTGITNKDGSLEYSFKTDKNFATLMIEKGSIALNGISLTIYNVEEDGFSVSIIPYTFEHTNMQKLKVNDRVNIEFDMIGKYLERIMKFRD